MEPPAGSRLPAGASPAPAAPPSASRRAEHRVAFYLILPLAAAAIIALAGAGVALTLAPTVLGLNAAVERVSERLREEGATFRRLPRPPERSVIYANDGKTVLATVYLDENREIVALDDVAPVAQEAVLAIEDHGFYEHGALNGESVLRALLTNLGSGTIVQGGSTITQQLVKNTLISNPRQTYARKLQEAALAIRMEQRYTKDEILELYLNEIYLGNGVYGIGTAAGYYFDTTPQELTLPQAATLAGMIASPEDYDPLDHPRASRRRRNAVLKAMDDYDLAAPRKTSRARRTELGVPRDAGTTGGGTRPFIVTYITRQILNDADGAYDSFGRTEKQRIHTLYQGGLRITTTLDPRWQQWAEAAARSHLPDARGTPDAAVVSVDNHTGGVRTLLSGKNYARDEFNLAAASRQTGSSFKPFTLVAAFRQGISPKSKFESKSPLHLPEWTNACHCVQNAESGPGGRIDLWEATQDSVNVVFAQLALEVGPAAIVDAAHDMGVTSPLLAVPSVTLGSNDVSPLDMAAAYQTLANAGAHCEPFMVARVEDAAGVLYRHRNECRQVIPREIADLVTAMLERVVGFGTGQNAQLLGRDVAGKTGTTQESTDAWFVGYTPQVTTSVWVGLPGNPRPMEQYFSTSVYGGTVAAPIWHDYMLRVLSGMPAAAFPPPPADFGKVLKPPPRPDVDVPDVVGLSLRDAESKLGDAGFEADANDVHSAKPEGIVVAQAPSAGAKAKEGSTVSLDVSSGTRPGVMVPAVVGRQSQAARAALHAAGFVVSVSVESVTQADKVGVVLAQSPAAGSRVRHGASVHITVGRTG
jgi:penicillin-binding protein 1A